MKKLTLFIVLALFIQPIVSAQPCLPDGITFTSQAEIDDFPTNYPNCTELEGDIIIRGDSINNLNGLSGLTSVGGNLWIEGNNALTSLTGLDNVTSIGGQLWITSNHALISLTGLDNVTSVEGDLTIGGDYGDYAGNSSLVSLTGLEGLTSIGGDLSISNNNALTSLAELDNIESISDLYITYNGSLSTCEAQWLCNYLANPTGSVNIYGNTSGCNNPLEVADSCGITLACLPFGNYYFFTQAEIDNFPTNYPNCTELEGDIIIRGDSINNLNGLSGLTSVGGNLWIEGNNALTSLTGLDNVTSIGGDLNIRGNDALTSLTGLDNVTSIGGQLWITSNHALISLTGLDNVTTIGGDLRIAINDTLTNLTGLNNLTSLGGGLYIGEFGWISYLTSLTGLEGLTSIGGDVRIIGNRVLTSLTGLDNLSFINGNFELGYIDYLYLGGNPSLTSLTGLGNLTSIGGYLRIVNNNALTSLAELDNIDSIHGLYIIGNNSLSSCEAQWLCDYLANPTGSVNIYDNAPGCNNPLEIADSCGITLPCLPFGNYYFFTQAEIDNFPTNYPNCTELEGDMIIRGYSINNLNGLSGLTSIGGDFYIGNSEGSMGGANPLLTNLMGLEGLTSVGGNLNIYLNEALTSLTGLEGLTSIGGFLKIQFNNGTLTSLTGLDNVTSIGGDLFIGYNHGLSVCEVQSICDYLDEPNGEISIYGNALGCNSKYEVEEACDPVSVDERTLSDKLLIYPNPSSTQITIELPNTPLKNALLSIYNMNSQQMLTSKITEQKTVVDISGLRNGIYFVKVADDKTMMVGKMVKN